MLREVSLKIKKINSELVASARIVQKPKYDKYPKLTGFSSFKIQL